MGRDEPGVAAGFGLSGDKEKDPLMQGGPLKVSAPMFPECVPSSASISCCGCVVESGFAVLR